MSVKPIQLFNGRWSVFWATTFSFEFNLFDEYLFRRLGEPPLNATILLDESCADATWDSIPVDEPWRLRRVNHDYLVRGVAFGTGRFHPKTYFFANEREGVLLVGSGNLGRSGLDRGNEVFSRFDSGNQEDVGTIRQWRDWTQAIVEESRDEALSARWWNVRTQAKWLAGDATGTFVANHREAIGTAFSDRAHAPVDELHLTAPFFDSDAQAVANLVRVLQPKALWIYLADHASVDGPSLGRAMDGADEAHLMRYHAPFVHAKLVAAIVGKSGHLLSGSANLSRAAMFSTPGSDAWSNVEAGTLVLAAADEIRTLFRPPTLDVVEVDLGELEDFAYVEPAEEDALTYSVRLNRAELEGDRSISFSTIGPTPPSARLSDGTSLLSLVKDESKTAESLPDTEGGRLVWLVDPEGEALSNRVPLDHPRALAKWLSERSSTSNHPRELDQHDLQTPIGRMLQDLNEQCIFDVEETDAGRRTQQVMSEEDHEETDPGFWERLGKEELMLDRRTASYRALGSGPFGDDDDVLRLLRLMLEKTPEERRAMRAGQVPIDGDGDADHEPKAGHTWTPTARLKVRLNNVLRRWCLALGDPKLRWLSPYAPVRNFAALCQAMAECWESGYLEEAKLLDLEQVLFERFIGTPMALGYVSSLDDDMSEEALAKLPADASAVATALLYAGIRPSGRWSDLIFDWQGFISPGLDLHVFEPNETSAQLASRLVGKPTTVDELVERLDWAVSFIDDPHWCAKMANVLGLDDVTFSEGVFSGPYKASLGIEGVEDPIEDPRVARLVKQLFDYRRTEGVTVIAGDWRLSILIGDQAYARPADPKADLLESNRVVTRDLLRELATAGVGLVELFPDLSKARATSGPPP